MVTPFPLLPQFFVFLRVEPLEQFPEASSRGECSGQRGIAGWCTLREATPPRHIWHGPFRVIEGQNGEIYLSTPGSQSIAFQPFLQIPQGMDGPVSSLSFLLDNHPVLRVNPDVRSQLMSSRVVSETLAPPSSRLSFFENPIPDTSGSNMGTAPRPSAIAPRTLVFPCALSP